MTNTTKDNRTGKAMVLTERDCQVVADVAAFQVLTREQLQALGHFRSKTRANAVLHRLERFGYLARRHQPAVAGTQRAVYCLAANGRALVLGPQELAAEARRVRQVSDLFLAHELLVNDVRISFIREPRCRVDRWMADRELRALRLSIVPDGYAEYDILGKSFCLFLELDRGTETFGRWQAKAKDYARLAASGQFRSVFGRQYFRVIALAPSTKRLEHLRRTTARVTDRIFWFTDLPSLRASGPFGHIWRRPIGDQLHSLTET